MPGGYGSTLSVAVKAPPNTRAIVGGAASTASTAHERRLVDAVLTGILRSFRGGRWRFFRLVLPGMWGGASGGASSTYRRWTASRASLGDNVRDDSEVDLRDAIDPRGMMGQSSLDELLGSRDRINPRAAGGGGAREARQDHRDRRRVPGRAVPRQCGRASDGRPAWKGRRWKRSHRLPGRTCILDSLRVPSLPSPPHPRTAGTLPCSTKPVRG